MTEEEKLAEEYYYKTYPVTLNIGEEERKRVVIDIFLAGLKAKIERIEKEKCELLGLIQAKDNLIEMMKCCATCKYWNYKDIQKYCNKRTGTPEFAGRLFKCDKWELVK